MDKDAATLCVRLLKEGERIIQHWVQLLVWVVEQVERHVLELPGVILGARDTRRIEHVRDAVRSQRAQRARDHIRADEESVLYLGADDREAAQLLRLGAFEDDDALVAQITGLTIGGAFEDEFREFFAVYLELCR